MSVQVDLFPRAEVYVPDDAVNLDDIGGSPGYSEYTQQHCVYSLSTIVRANFRRAEELRRAQPLLDTYTKWRDDNIAQIRESLETVFPGRWDMKVITDVLHTNYLTILADRLLRCDGDMVKFNNDGLLPTSCYEMTIYFPELVVTNSLGHVWTIKDYYVIIQLDAKLSIRSMLGYRATKTLREHELHYTHSHSKCANNDLVSFCLGSTSLDTLVAELRLSFDMIKMELFFQTLPDYLSWESLEGVPFLSIKELVTHVAPQQRRPDLAHGTLQSIIAVIIDNRPCLRVNIRIVDGVASCTLIKSKELLRLITPLVNPRYTYPLNDTSLLSVYDVPVNVATINAQIKDLNKREVGNTKLIFRGNSVYMRIEEMEVTEEKKVELELFADTRIMDELVFHIEQNLTRYLNDSYWYGTEERRVPES